jgi:hypothetical protein
METLQMTDSPAIQGREAKYQIVQVDTAKTLKSWQRSLFSFEWLTPEGKIRSADQLPMRDHEIRLEVEAALKAGKPLERPVLGIGIMDNVEIGAGRGVFLTLADAGHTTIEVHIPNGNLKDFKPFIKA